MEIIPSTKKIVAFTQSYRTVSPDILGGTSYEIMGLKVYFNDTNVDHTGSLYKAANTLLHFNLDYGPITGIKATIGQFYGVIQYLNF